MNKYLYQEFIPNPYSENRKIGIYFWNKLGKNSNFKILIEMLKWIFGSLKLHISYTSLGRIGPKLAKFLFFPSGFLRIHQFNNLHSNRTEIKIATILILIFTGTNL